MRLTAEEIKDLAKSVVSKVLVTFMEEIPGITKAADRDRQEWNECLDDVIQDIEDMLLNRLGA